MKWNLRLGDVSQRLAVADLTKGGDAVLAEMVPESGDVVVYSDPPWNPGNEKYWRRHAGLEPPRAYQGLLTGWCRAVVACRPRHVFVEQSINKAHQRLLLDVVAETERWELPLLEQWVVQYGSPKRPNALLHFGSEKLQNDPSGLSGEKMTRVVFKGFAEPGVTVCDPCMGLGMTSRVAHRFGINCIGTELNEARLRRTVDRLRARGYS